MALIRNVHRLRNCISILGQNPVVLKEISQSFIRPSAVFSTSGATSLKEVLVNTTDDLTTVEGKFIEPAKTDQVALKAEETAHDFCPICPSRLGVELTYTDVLVLSQFMRADGCVLPRYVTGVCEKAQRKLERLVHKAQRAGLMPELRPDLKDGRERTSLKSRYKWRKYNIYYHNAK